MEAILDRGRPYMSGPQWLRENVLHEQVGAGGRRHARQDDDDGDARVDPRETPGLKPGFLIGGVPLDFGVSARLTDSACSS